MIYPVCELCCLSLFDFFIMIFSIGIVRLEPILIELEREQEDLLIISHASVIRCLLAYLIGLPATEIPAIEIARGDLIEVISPGNFQPILKKTYLRLFPHLTVFTVGHFTFGMGQAVDITMWNPTIRI